MSEEKTMSKSAAKRDARRKEVIAARGKAKLEKIVGTVIGVAIAAVFLAAIGMGVWYSIDTTTSSTNYSTNLTDEGYIMGADLSKVKAIDFKSLTVAKSDIDFSDADVQSSINSVLSNYAYFDEATDKAIEDGDTINLDYTGYLDGKAFDGGSTDGNGSELTIGSNTFVGTFEEQLIGHKIGESFTIEVTFPDEYENNPELAGKLTTFDITINSIQVTPEFTDEFVAENLADKAQTVEEYKAVIKEEGIQDNLESYLTKYVEDNASASKVPSAYIKNLRSTLKNDDEQTMEYMNNLYSMYMGYTPYSKLSDYTGVEGRDYEVTLKNNAKKTAALKMTYEEAFKAAGLTISEDEYNAEAEEFDAETYGKGYIMQHIIQEKVIEYAKSVVTIQ